MGKSKKRKRDSSGSSSESSRYCCCRIGAERPGAHARPPADSRVSRPLMSTCPPRAAAKGGGRRTATRSERKARRKRRRKGKRKTRKAEMLALMSRSAQMTTSRRTQVGARMQACTHTYASPRVVSTAPFHHLMIMCSSLHSMLVNDSRLDAEFRVWLSETKGKKFGDLDEKETKKYFEKVCLWQACAAHLLVRACLCVLSPRPLCVCIKDMSRRASCMQFVDKYNSGSLPEKMYKGIAFRLCPLPNVSRYPIATRTALALTESR